MGRYLGERGSIEFGVMVERVEADPPDWPIGQSPASAHHTLAGISIMMGWRAR